MNTRFLGVCALAFLLAADARADVRTKAVQEAVEFAAKKFGWKVGQEVMESTAKRLETHAARHGDDMIHAFRQVGTKSFDVAEKHGVPGLKMVARHGDGAVVHVLARPTALALAGRLGDDAADALVKHPGIAEGVLERLGAPAAKALAAVDPRNGRRLAMMAAEGGDLAKIGRADEVLGVVGKYGDRAMRFVWDHKAALAVAATLATFLADPEPYLSGARELSTVVAEAALQPVAEGVGRAAETAVASAAPEVGRRTNWTAVLSLPIVALIGLLVIRRFTRPLVGG